MFLSSMLFPSVADNKHNLNDKTRELCGKFKSKCKGDDDVAKLAILCLLTLSNHIEVYNIFKDSQGESPNYDYIKAKCEEIVGQVEDRQTHQPYNNPIYEQCIELKCKEIAASKDSTGNWTINRKLFE